MQDKIGRSTFVRLLDNFLALSTLQAVNYLVPIIIFPYLVRVLGVEQFGLFSFVMAVINYGVIITDYGFDLAATKHISTYRDLKEKVDEVFSSVIIIKMAMAVAFLFVLTLLILGVEKFWQHASLYYLAFGVVIGQVLFPGWFFQGIEKMRYITILNALSKIVFALAIFLFVHDSTDLPLVLLFNALGGIVAGTAAFWIAYRQFGVRFVWQSRERLLFYLKDAWYIFTSRVAVQLYQSINIIILGFFVSNTLVGYYSIAEKIVRALGNIMSSLTRALYPYLGNLYQESVALFYKRNMMLTFLIFFIMAPIAAGTYLYAQEILALVMGMEPPPPVAVNLLKIFAPVLTIYLYGNQFTNILVILNEKKLLNSIVVIAGLLNLLFAPWIIYFFGVVGLMWINVFFSLFIFVVKGYYIFIKFRKRDLRAP
jgi:PST family polysaccharide transporter